MANQRTETAALLQSLEERLLEHSVRQDSDSILQLLAEEFQEFGSSGRVYDREEILHALGTEPVARLSLAGFRATMLSPSAALVTYESVHSDVSGKETGKALRSSVWILRDGRWQMLFHQGTKVAAQAEILHT